MNAMRRRPSWLAIVLALAIVLGLAIRSAATAPTSGPALPTTTTCLTGRCS